MHSIRKPDIEFGKLFNQCLEQTNMGGKDNLNEKFNLISNAAKSYNCKANKRKLFEIKPISQEELKPIIVKLLKQLYTDKMVRKKSPGRDNYDAIIASAKKYHCCFCSHEVPTEIDHFLPKSKYPEFSILPINLVPCCNRCNRLKANDSPTSFNECFIHPYFEDYSDIVWLEATLNFDETHAPNVIYHIATNLKELDIELSKKIEHQLIKLQLDQRYSLCANTEISQIEHRLKTLKETVHANGVREHLHEEAVSRSNFNRNSWQSALYNCLYQNEEFCEAMWVI